jgi:hypothetical protein
MTVKSVKDDILSLMAKLTPEILNAAIEGFEEQKKRIDAQLVELRQMLEGGPASRAAEPEAVSPKRKISAAARRRMALGQQKRWAAIKSGAQSTSPITSEPPQTKRRISEEGMKRIIAATKKRWALKKAEAAKAKAAVAKNAPGKVAKKSAAKKAVKTPGQATPAAQ